MKLATLGVILLMATPFLAGAQNTIPRFGTTPNQDNTGRQLTYGYVLSTDNPGPDTVNLVPIYWESIIQVNPVVDSLAFNVSSLAYSYVGDQLVFQVVNSPGTGHRIKFVGTNFQFGSGGSALALSSGNRATITFTFDGTYWLETSRLVQ